MSGGKATDVAREAGGRLLRRVQQAVGGSSGTPDPDPRSRWRSVTVNRSEEDVLPDGRLPAPLAALGDLVEVQTRPAPGGKGTELSARLRDSIAAEADDGGDRRQQVRSALREAKQLIEVGEVLRVDPTPHGPRSATPSGRLVESATKRAGGEGLL